MSTIPDWEPVVAITPAPLKLNVVTSLSTVIPSSDTVTGEPSPPPVISTITPPSLPERPLLVTTTPEPVNSIAPIFVLTNDPV